MSRKFNSEACTALFSGGSRSGLGDLEPLPDHPDRRDFALLPDREWLATLAAAVHVTIEL